jgi:uncharacterized protein with LGFP repeats
MPHLARHPLPVVLITCFLLSLSAATISAQRRRPESSQQSTTTTSAQPRPASSQQPAEPRPPRRRPSSSQQIEAKFAELTNEGGGAPLGVGSPISDEQATDDGGRFRRYEHGFIYWSRATGAHAVYGIIGAKWAELGFEKSALGYPITDELPGPTPNGRVNEFQHGMIRSTPEHGVVVLLDETAVSRLLREHLRGGPQEPEPTGEAVVTHTILVDGSVETETRSPDGTVVKVNGRGTTTIYPDGHSEFKPHRIITITVQEIDPPLSPSDSGELNRWREYHARILLDIIRNMIKSDDAVNKLLNSERSRSLTTYGQINLRTKAIHDLMAK